MNATNKERLTAGLILTGMATSMFIPLILWFIHAPHDLFSRMGVDATANVTKIPLAWALSLVTAAAYIRYTAYGNPTVGQNLFRFGWFKWVGIYAALPSGILEEIFFRQMLMDWLQDAGTNAALQIACSALLFGIAHGVWGLFARNRRFALGAVASTGGLGLLLALTYIVGGRNVLPAIVAHVAINLFIEPWLILGAVKSAGAR